MLLLAALSYSSRLPSHQAIKMIEPWREWCDADQHGNGSVVVILSRSPFFCLTPLYRTDALSFLLFREGFAQTALVFFSFATATALPELCWLVLYYLFDVP